MKNHDISMIAFSQPVSQKLNFKRIFYRVQEIIGDYGGYQKLSILIWCVISYILGGLLFLTPFIFYEETFPCIIQNGKQICLKEICSLEKSERNIFNKQYIISSFIQSFVDPCEQEQIGLIQTYIYSSAIIAFTLMTVIGDRFGQRILLLGAMGLTIIGLSLMIAGQSIWMASSGLFIALIGSLSGFNIVFLYLSEIVREDKRQKSGIIIQMFYGMGMIINTGAFYAIKNWRIIIGLFYLLPSVLVLILLLLYIKDTPMCLINLLEPEEALKNLLFIAKMNNIQPSAQQFNEEYIFSIKYDVGACQKETQFSFLDIFKFKSLRIKTILLVILQSVIIFQFYSPALLISQFKFNIFINGLVVGLSQIIAYPLGYILMTVFKRKTIAYISFTIVLLCSISLVFLWKNGQSSSVLDLKKDIWILVLIFGIRFAIASQYCVFIIYCNQIYPTQIRVIGTSIISLFGGISSTSIPFIINVLQNKNFNIMIIFAILSAICIFVSVFLPQTSGVQMSDVIQEMVVKNQERSKKRITTKISKKTYKLTRMEMCIDPQISLRKTMKNPRPSTFSKNNQGLNKSVQITRLLESIRGKHTKNNITRRHVQQYLFTFALQIGCDIPSDLIMKQIMKLLLTDSENQNQIPQSNFYSLVSICLTLYKQSKTTPIGGIFDRLQILLKQKLYYQKVEQIYSNL